MHRLYYVAADAMRMLHFTFASLDR